LEIFGIISSTYLRIKLMNEDQITTTTGIVKAAVLILGLFGVHLSPQSTDVIVTAGGAIYAVATLIGGWWTNKKVS
jgi:protein-S-isoprenylcysteine O-methyltransferase Ste14